MIHLFVNEFNELEGLYPYIIKSELLESILKQIKKEGIKKQEMVDVVFIIKTVILSYSKHFCNFNLHISNPSSLRQLIPGIVYPKTTVNYNEFSDYILKTELFQYFLEYLKKNISLNNMLNSAIMHCIKLATYPMIYNPFMKLIREYNFDIDSDKNNCQNAVEIRKNQNILKRIEVPEEADDRVERKNYHEEVLEQEKEDNYLMAENTEGQKEDERISDNQTDRHMEEQLLKMKEEIKKKRETEN